MVARLGVLGVFDVLALCVWHSCILSASDV